jgi:8-amino-7-oxononanoate synthase
MNKLLCNRLTKQLQLKAQQTALRQLNPLQQNNQPGLCVSNNRTLVDFASNDYLGLAKHPKVIEALSTSAKAYGVGSTGSRLITGTSDLHLAFEQRLATFTGRSRALLFNSGYAANCAMLACFTQKTDQIFADKLNHASLNNAAINSPAKFYRYPHLDYQALAKRLENNTHATSGQSVPFIVSDAVFSMDGDCIELSKLIELSNAHQAELILDDAHGFGVLGDKGQGLVASQATEGQVPLLMATLGKALGVHGAFVAGASDYIEYLSQFASEFIYTTALPAPLIASADAALTLLQQGDCLAKLQANIAYFQQAANALDMPLKQANTQQASAIQIIELGDNALTLAVAQALEQQGIKVGAIRPPTVPANSARLRLCLSAAHSTEQIDNCLDILAKTLNNGSYKR